MSILGRPAQAFTHHLERINRIASCYRCGAACSRRLSKAAPVIRFSSVSSVAPVRASSLSARHIWWRKSVFRQRFSCTIPKGRILTAPRVVRMQIEGDRREEVARFLPEDTLWVRFVFVDHAGIPKAKAVYKDSFQERAEAGVGLASGVMALDPTGQLHTGSGLNPVGEVRLVPDLTGLTQLPFAPGQAMVPCDITEPDGSTPWPGCPRGALRRVLEHLAERGLESLASFETEFYLIGPEGPLDKTPYAGSFALTPAAEFAAALSRTLKEMGSP